MPNQDRIARPVPALCALAAVCVLGSLIVGAAHLTSLGPMSGPGADATGAGHAGQPPAAISVVAAENFYGNVIGQIGGRHVSVISIISNPNTDPHSYESSTADARAIAGASLVIQNGLGYDSFMQQLEDASPNPKRTVIDVGRLFGRTTGDNPHQWYDPTTMPRVAALAAARLSRLDPANKGIYQANLRLFDASLTPWRTELASLRRRFKGTPIAVTEPVFGYAAAAIGLNVLTPQSLQLAIQEGNDPAPQDMQAEQDLLSGNRVRLFAYNRQVIAPITTRLLPIAHAHHVPVVGVYETMPASMDYQQWMLAEDRAVDNALSHGTSTETLR